MAIRDLLLINTGAPIVACTRLTNHSALAMGDGSIQFVDPSGICARVKVHEDGILSAASVGDLVLTGGDDGTVALTSPDGTSRVVARHSGQWIDNVCGTRPDGAIVWSSGKEVFAECGGKVRRTTLPSTPTGLALNPSSRRVAVAHYGGVTLWDFSGDTHLLDWKGSHIGVTWSPCGRYVVTSMQERELHGWRLANNVDMRMPGYEAKIRSLSWNKSGRWLATSGADIAVLWSFGGNGPWNKNPRELGRKGVPVTRVAFHPDHTLIAVGYSDGMVAVTDIRNEEDELLRRPDGDPISALDWSPSRTSVAFGTEGGKLGLASAT